MDPRLGIDTSGPGEAVFAIRFNGKTEFEWTKNKSEPEKKTNKTYKIRLGPFLGTN